MKKINIILLLALSQIIYSQEWNTSSNNYTTGNIGIGLQNISNNFDLNISNGISSSRLAFINSNYKENAVIEYNAGAKQLRFQHWDNKTTWKKTMFNIDILSGKVGIGTTLPDELLTVNGNISFNGKLVNNGSSTFLSFEKNDSYNPAIEFFNKDSSITPGAMLISMGENSEAYMSFGREGGGIAFDEKMRINPNGNIGIGTNNPNAKLEIMNGDIHVNKSSSTGNYKIRFRNNSASFGYDSDGSSIGQYGAYIATSDTSKSFYIAPAGITKFAFKSNGNMGVGSISPQEKLDVNGNLVINGQLLNKKTSTFLSFNRSDSYNPTIEFFNKDSSKTPGAMMISMGENSDAFMSFGREGGGFSFDEKMRINSNGNIGIGTSDPKNKLSVNGHIWAKEIKVQLTDGADWVFNDDYNLPPLSQVENYIKENKHLPEIPSANEFRENDMKVSEMMNKLLQKIEELTLYTIEQQKEIEKLKLENKNHKN